MRLMSELGKCKMSAEQIVKTTGDLKNDEATVQHIFIIGGLLKL